MKLRNLLIFGMAVMAGLIAMYLVLGSDREYTFQGSLIEPAVPAPQFELTDMNGNPFQLNQLEDQVAVMFFGYTSCPDVCPVTLTEFLQIRSKLGQAAAHVSFVFITVDPERDTAERMRKYLTNFDPEIIGLTGERSELEPVWVDYGVYQARVEGSSDENYLVDHSSRVYVIDRDGNLRLTYLFGTDSKLITDDIRHLVSQD
ncbi:MAG: SCO family protein [Anaerolineales bacterium]|jgi:protein SCO1/2